MINYIKTHKLTAERLKGLTEVLWNDEKYMKPVEMDAWLMFGIWSTLLTKMKFSYNFNYSIFADIEDLKESLPNGKTSEIDILKEQLKEKDVLIEQLLDQMNQMKSSFHAWVERTANEPADLSENSVVNMPTAELVEQTHVASIPIDQDEPYFITYSHFDIHYDMLSVSLNIQSDFKHF